MFRLFVFLAIAHGVHSKEMASDKETLTALMTRLKEIVKFQNDAADSWKGLGTFFETAAKCNSTTNIIDEFEKLVNGSKTECEELNTQYKALEALTRKENRPKKSTIEQERADFIVLYDAFVIGNTLVKGNPKELSGNLLFSARLFATECQRSLATLKFSNVTKCDELFTIAKCPKDETIICFNVVKDAADLKNESTEKPGTTTATPGFYEAKFQLVNGLLRALTLTKPSPPPTPTTPAPTSAPVPNALPTVPLPNLNLFPGGAYVKTLDNNPDNFLIIPSDLDFN